MGRPLLKCLLVALFARIQLVHAGSNSAHNSIDVTGGDRPDGALLGAVNREREVGPGRAHETDEAVGNAMHEHGEAHAWARDTVGVQSYLPVFAILLP